MKIPDEVSALWLRLHCPEDRDLLSGQRLVDIADLPVDPQIASSWTEDGEFCVRWEGDDRISRLPRELPAPPQIPVVGWERIYWGEYDRFDQAAWSTALVTQGIAFLRGVPLREGTVLEFAGRAGCVYETNYGRMFDVRAVPNPENLAYTNLGLGLHTDNPYRDSVPGYQLLHCLEQGDSGGESLFADGFAAAEQLRHQDRIAFNLLTLTPVEFAFRSEDADLRADRPILQISNDRVEAVHWNSRSLGTLRMPTGRLSAFIGAYRQFALLLADPARLLRLMLQPGDLVAFDNHRTVHGRTAFTTAVRSRHLQGCYLTRDSVRSNYRVLNRG